MDTWATSSLTPADRRAAGPTIPSCSRGRSRWTCVRRRTTSSAPGCSRRCCARSSSTTRCRGRTRRFPDWSLDPDRKKMSKSKGNVVTPLALLEEHGSDGVRYWAASGRPGHRHDFDPDQMRVGRRLAIKVLNASKFVLGAGRSRSGAITAAGRSRDAAQPRGAGRRGDRRAFDGYDYAPRAAANRELLLAVLRRLPRARQGATLRRPGRRQAPARPTRALTAALSVLLRLFAPFLPFVTEEVWSWWQDGSMHTARVADGERARRAARRRLGGDARVRSGRLRVGDRGAVRSAEAAVGGQAAAEGADHPGDGAGRARQNVALDADRRGRSARRRSASRRSRRRVGEPREIVVVGIRAGGRRRLKP